jgi:uncharacterized protein with von Willebrand factor type A (vWA) domain
MPSDAECRARAAEYDRKAEASANAGVRQFYHSLAQHWRSLALLAEAKTEREQSEREQSEREQSEREQSAASGPRAGAPHRVSRFPAREERHRAARVKRGGIRE